MEVASGRASHALAGSPFPSSAPGSGDSIDHDIGRPELGYFFQIDENSQKDHKVINKTIM